MMQASEGMGHRQTLERKAWEDVISETVPHFFTKPIDHFLYMISRPLSLSHFIGFCIYNEASKFGKKILRYSLMGLKPEKILRYKPEANKVAFWRILAHGILHFWSTRILSGEVLIKFILAFICSRDLRGLQEIGIDSGNACAAEFLFMCKDGSFLRLLLEWRSTGMCMLEALKIFAQTWNWMWSNSIFLIRV